MLDKTEPATRVRVVNAPIKSILKLAHLCSVEAVVTADLAMERKVASGRHGAQAAMFFLGECGVCRYDAGRLVAVPGRVEALAGAVASGDLAAVHGIFLGQSGYRAVWESMVARGSLREAESQGDVAAALGEVEGAPTYFNSTMRIVVYLDRAWVSGRDYMAGTASAGDPAVAAAVAAGVRASGDMSLADLVTGVSLAAGTTPNQVMRFLAGQGPEGLLRLGVELVPTSEGAPRPKAMGSTLLKGTLAVPVLGELVIGRLALPGRTFDSVRRAVSPSMPASPSAARLPQGGTASLLDVLDDVCARSRADGGAGAHGPGAVPAAVDAAGEVSLPGRGDIVADGPSAMDVVPYPSPAAFEAAGFSFGERGVGLPYGWSYDPPDGWSGDTGAFAWDERGRERVRKTVERDGTVLHRLLPRFAARLVDSGLDRAMVVPAGWQSVGVTDAGRLALCWEPFDAEDVQLHDMYRAEVDAWMDLVLPHHREPGSYWDLASLPPDGAGATRYPPSPVRGRVALPATLAEPAAGLASLGFDFDDPLPDGTVPCMLPPGWRAGGARWRILDERGRERVGPVAGGGAALRTRYSVVTVTAGTDAGRAVGLGLGRALAAVMDAGVPMDDRVSHEHRDGDAAAAAAEVARMSAYLDAQRPAHRDPHAYWSSGRVRGTR